MLVRISHNISSGLAEILLVFVFAHVYLLQIESHSHYFAE